MSKLSLYSRRHCHLCDDMHAALVAMQAEFRFELEVIDVDLDPVLVAKYDQLVPLLEADGIELCRYFPDPARVREYLSEHP